MRDHASIAIPLWTGKASTPAGARLTEDVDADVCVMGAGIAGVTTASFLAREGRSVVLVDFGRPSSGQTARTTAHLENADDRIEQVERLRGTEAARVAVQSHEEAIDWNERLCLEEHIDAEFRRLDGYLSVGEGDTAPGLFFALFFRLCPYQWRSHSRRASSTEATGRPSSLARRTTRATSSALLFARTPFE